jgi:dolichol-phosphate mannosyltransferase
MRSFWDQYPYAISVIVPIFNEQDNIEPLFQQVHVILAETRKPFEIIFVNDGSTDQSLQVLHRLYQKHKGTVKIINFSRNFGHQLALTAGLEHCRGKAAVIIDADLQDPPSLIKEFIRKWEAGYEIVYGVRKERQGETFFKKYTATLFYKLIRIMTAIDIPANVGDFYLLDRKIINILNSLKERHRFIRGLVAWVGYKRTGIEYVRNPRANGKTKYSFWKMCKFSFDAVTSFSFTPLRFISLIGATFSVVSFLAILVIIYEKLFTDYTIVGWSSLMVVVLFIGGLQLLALGMIGEYIARIGDDVRGRPLYSVNEFFD